MELCTSPGAEAGERRKFPPLSGLAGLLTLAVRGLEEPQNS